MKAWVHYVRRYIFSYCGSYLRNQVILFEPKTWENGHYVTYEQRNSRSYCALSTVWSRLFLFIKVFYIILRFYILDQGPFLLLRPFLGIVTTRTYASYHQVTIKLNLFSIFVLLFISKQWNKIMLLSTYDIISVRLCDVIRNSNKMASNKLITLKEHLKYLSSCINVPLIGRIYKIYAKYFFFSCP